MVAGRGQAVGQVGGARPHQCLVRAPAAGGVALRLEESPAIRRGRTVARIAQLDIGAGGRAERHYVAVGMPSGQNVLAARQRIEVGRIEKIFDGELPQMGVARQSRGGEEIFRQDVRLVIRRILDADPVAAHGRDEGQGAADDSSHEVGWDEGVVGSASVGADLASPAGFALRTGKPVISNHLENEERFRTPELLVEHGIRRAMNVILQGDGSPFGVLEVDSRSEGEFSEHDVAFLQGAANILGMAIEQKNIIIILYLNYLN